MANKKSNSCDSVLRKGISPVIATILLVMITVVLIAFSYMWMSGMTTNAQTNTQNQMNTIDQQNQQISISTIFGNSSTNTIYFKIVAAPSNTYAINVSGAGYFYNDVPVTLSAWDGGMGKPSCDSVGALSTGGICFGKITVTTCNPASVLRVAPSPGKADSKSVGSCK